MSDRTVRVRLEAITTQFQTAMVQASVSVKGVQAEVSKQSVSSRQAYDQIGKAALVAGAAGAAGLALAARATMGFDKQLSQLQASTQASAGTMEQLRAAALKTGKDTMFSASQAAEAETALAKAGVSVADILGGALAGATSLAAAGQLELGAAAEITAGTLAQFNLAGSQASHVSDLLAAGAGKAQGDVSDMAMALKQSGLVAAQTGLTVEETTGALAAFANQSLLGSDAGTSFKTMLQRLNPQSDEAAQLMSELGLSAYDSQGEFVGLANYAGQLQSALSGMSSEQRNAALSTLFGSDAVRAAAVLYKEGASGVQTWIDNVNDTGYAARFAATATDNLSGDVERLGGSLKTAMIEGGTGATGVLRGLVQTAESGVEVFSALPGPLQTAAFGLGAFGSAGLLAVGAAAKLVPAFAQAEANLVRMGVSAPLAARGMSTLSLALKGGVIAGVVIGVAAGLDQLTEALVKPPPGVEKLTGSLLDLAETGRATGAMAATFGQDLSGVAEALDQVGQSNLGSWTETIFTFSELWGGDTPEKLKQGKVNLEAIDQALAGLVQSGNAEAAAEAYEHLLDTIGRDLSPEQRDEAFKAYGEALAGMENQSRTAAAGQGQLGGALDGTTGDVDAQVKSMSDLFDEIQGVTNQVLGLRDANRGYESAVDDAAKALTDNGKTLDVHSEKGRANGEALDAIARASADVLKGMIDNQAPMSAVTQTFQSQQAQLSRTAQAFGMSKAQADTYARSVLAIPERTDTDVALKGVPEAVRQVQSLTAYLKGLPGSKSVTVRYNEVLGTTVQRGSYAGRITERASGGILPGPPSSTDNMYISAASGEYVVNAQATAQHRALLEAINSGRMPGFATGGVVGGGSMTGRTGGVNPAPGGLLATALGMGNDVDSIRAMTAAWEDYIRAMDAAARRRELVTDASTARREYDTAKGIEARTTALGRLNDANARLRDYDVDAAREQQRRAVDALTDSLERQAKAQEQAARVAAEAAADMRDSQDNRFTIGALGEAEYLRLLDERMVTERRHSDEWTALWQQRKRIVEQAADAEVQALRAVADAHRAAVDEATRSRDTAAESLNRLLDSEADIRQRQVEVTGRAAEQIMALQGQQVQAEAEFYAERAAAGQEFAADQDRLVSDRASELADSLRIDQQMQRSWGSSVAWLAANTAAQAQALRDWTGHLAQARGRGVSEDVIAALGLDAGPEAIGQLQQINAASLSEIDALNAAVADRAGAARAQADREATLGLGKLGADLSAAQQRYADDAARMEADYLSRQADLSDQIAQAQADLRAEQIALSVELAAVGQEQGRSYGAAIAAGMSSEIPAVRAATAALQAAMTGLAVAQSAATISTAGTVMPSRDTTTGSGSDMADRLSRQRAGRTSGADDLSRVDPAVLALLNSGALTQPPTAGSTDVRVFIGERELTDIVDVQVGTGLSKRRTAARLVGSIT